MSIYKLRKEIKYVRRYKKLLQEKLDQVLDLRSEKDQEIGALKYQIAQLKQKLERTQNA